MPILELYMAALYTSALGVGFNRRTILEVKDKAKYIEGNQQHAEWWNANAYCYEITADTSISENTMKKWMAQDLNRYLNLNGRIEKRKIKVWLLVLSDKALLETKGGEPVADINADEHTIILKNQPISELESFLNYYTNTNPFLPIVNDINLKTNIDINLAIKEGCDLDGLKKTLRPFGINVVEREKVMNAFVLTENNGF